MIASQDDECRRRRIEAELKEVALHPTPATARDLPAADTARAGGFDIDRFRLTVETVQAARPAYSSRLRALRALRNEVEADAAANLRRIDMWIEEEQEQHSGNR